MESSCHSEEAAKVQQLACQSALGADERSPTLRSCAKSFILCGNKIHRENDLIFSLWKYTSSVINCLRRRSDHLSTALAWKFPNLRSKNVFSRIVPIHSHGCSLSPLTLLCFLASTQLSWSLLILCKQCTYNCAVSWTTAFNNNQFPLSLSLKINHIYKTPSEVLLTKSIYFIIYTNVTPTLLCSKLLCICQYSYCLTNLEFAWKICGNIYTPFSQQA